MLPEFLKNLGYCDEFFLLDFDNPHSKSGFKTNNIKLIWKKEVFNQVILRTKQKVIQETVTS